MLIYIFTHRIKKAAYHQSYANIIVRMLPVPEVLFGMIYPREFQKAFLVHSCMNLLINTSKVHNFGIDGPFGVFLGWL
jgi:hypothetical protein